MLLVTHDRYFLDRVVTRIVEIEGGQIFSHAGNYSDFLANKAEREVSNQKAEHNRRAAMKRELAWLNRTPWRAEANKKHVSNAPRHCKRNGSIRRDKTWPLMLLRRRTGKQIMEISHISKPVDDLTVIDDFSYVIDRRARLGIVGPNGAGKVHC